MMHVMASIVVRSEHATAARGLHVAAACATAGPMLAAAPEIVTFTRVDAA